MSNGFFHFSRSSFRHLRIPFSFFLLPVYLMALVMVPEFDGARAVAILISLHVLLYPGASGFNAFYDRDTTGIGMLEHPPAVAPDLLRLSLLLKTAAVLTAFFAGPVMAGACFLYATASVLYSWDRVRIKKRPFAGWLLTGIGQGFIMFMAIAASLPAGGPATPSPGLTAGALCMTVMMLAASPLLEIFQHREDTLRGDLTISRFAGIRGTLLLSGTLFIVATTGFTLLIASVVGGFFSVLFLISLIPALPPFVRLSLRVFRDGAAPDYGTVMPVALAASAGLNAFCISTLLLRLLFHHVR